MTAYFNGIWEKAVAAHEKMLQTDSTNQHILHRIGESYMYLGKHEESLKYLKKWFTEGSKASYFWFQGIPGFVYVYLRNGFENEADYHFRESIKHFNKVKEQAGSATDHWTYYGLGAVYAFKGEKDIAYENLRMFVKKLQVPNRLSLIRIKNDPLFNSIRDEPEFQQIVRDLEANYLAEHERVERWLEENDIL
jgi:tetratricopeptide (TPR) repeat protein